MYKFEGDVQVPESRRHRTVHCKVRGDSKPGNKVIVCTPKALRVTLLYHFLILSFGMVAFL